MLFGRMARLRQYVHTKTDPQELDGIGDAEMGLPHGQIGHGHEKGPEQAHTGVSEGLAEWIRHRHDANAC